MPVQGEARPEIEGASRLELTGRHRPMVNSEGRNKASKWNGDPASGTNPGRHPVNTQIREGIPPAETGKTLGLSQEIEKPRAERHF